MAAAEAAIAISACDTLSLDAIEINNTLNGSQLLNLSGGTNASIGTIRSEVSTYALSNQYVLYFTDSHVSIDTLEFTTMTVNTPSGQVYGIYNSGGSGTVIANIINLGVIVSSGKFYLVAGGSGTIAFQNTFNRINGLVGTTNCYLTNAGSSATSASTQVGAWNIPNPTTVGDVNLSLAAGVNNPLQIFNVNLTAPRIVTLSDQAGGADSNLYTGFKWKIVNSQPTYSYGLTINNAGGGTVATLASNGYVEMTWYRFGWVVTGYATWTGTTP